MRPDTEKTAATLKCTHVAISGFTIDTPNQSRVVRIVVPMNRCRRTERDEVVSLRVRLCTGVLNVYVEVEKKIVFLLARLQQRKFLSDRDSVRHGALAPNAAVGLTRQRKLRKRGLCGVVNHRADGHVLGRIQGHVLSVFADVIEHNRLGNAAAAVSEAQFEI
jgi:hypothetical protein